MDYYIEPLKLDCEDLLHRFQETESVRYEVFAAVWRKMDFPSIFYGKMAANEMRAFSRLILTTAYPYFLPPYSFHIRVGGLYLLYGLYNTQLASPKEKIRIALKDWENINKFQEDAMNAQHYDVSYIFRKLISEKAFYFAAMPKHLFFRVKRKTKRPTVCDEFWDRPMRVMDLVTTETLEEIVNVQEHYEKAKQAICGTPGQPDPAINLVSKDLVQRLHSTVVTYHNWLDEAGGKKKERGDADAGEGTSKQSEASQRAERLASIKSKSYGQAVEAVKSRRHRQVEIGSSETGGGQATPRRNKSLKARITKKMTGKVKEEILSGETTTAWRLSIAEQKSKGKTKGKRRFKW
ncbi:hypothetical protein AAFF_G00153540 [Aldrovandia affinis]|uniref:snRNA-activating protein complex subunit 1 n=1 Tax=Aldrovandia affinis TaxID=143900 RepID=A0AAD7WW30_9TELE|nr:hypothetical protein AAFF_G00153540 [Aldrovandia affinis]